MRWVPFTIPIHRWRNWGTKRLNNLSTITQLIHCQSPEIHEVRPPKMHILPSLKLGLSFNWWHIMVEKSTCFSLLAVCKIIEHLKIADILPRINRIWDMTSSHLPISLCQLLILKWSFPLDGGEGRHSQDPVSIPSSSFQLSGWKCRKNWQKVASWSSRQQEWLFTVPAWDGVFGNQPSLCFCGVRAPAKGPCTWHPFWLPSAESKPILSYAEMEPGNSNKNSGATAEGTSKVLELLNKTRICVHFLGGKYYHMCLKLSHHLVCADMNPLGRVSIWLGKRFPSPAPPNLPCSPSISCRCWNNTLTDSFPTLECRPREECGWALWPPSTLSYEGPPTFSRLCIKPLAARCQVLSACSTNLV